MSFEWLATTCLSIKVLTHHPRLFLVIISPLKKPSSETANLELFVLTFRIFEFQTVASKEPEQSGFGR